VGFFLISGGGGARLPTRTRLRSPPSPKKREGLRHIPSSCAGFRILYEEGGGGGATSGRAIRQSEVLVM